VLNCDELKQLFFTAVITVLWK